jgi:hypothetical protein
MENLVGYNSDSDSEDSNSPSGENGLHPALSQENSPNEGYLNRSPMLRDDSDDAMEVETNPDAASEYSCQLRRLSSAGQSIEIVLPPPPPGKTDSRIAEKLRIMSEQHRAGHDFNKYIRNKKSFRNPSIYSKLIQYFEVEEGGSNFPKDAFDPRAYKLDEKHSYKEIAKVQQIQEDKRQEELKKRTKVDFTSSKKSSRFDGPAVVTSKTKSQSKTAIPAVGELAKSKSRSRK